MSTKIGFYGFGKMAEAIWQGMTEVILLPPQAVSFYRRSVEKSQEISKKYQLNAVPPTTLIQRNDIILLCVKPQGIQEVLAEIKAQFPEEVLVKKTWVSIIAGTPISVFKDYLGQNAPICRIMPNTPSVLKAGISGLCFSDDFPESHKGLILKIFNALGKTLILDEEQLHLVTGISGSGPAYFYALSDAVKQIAQENDLDEQVALTLFAQTLIGAGHMLLESGMSAHDLIEQVASPGGTTRAGLATMEEVNLINGLKKVMESAITRSVELSKG